MLTNRRDARRVRRTTLRRVAKRKPTSRPRAERASTPPRAPRQPPKPPRPSPGGALWAQVQRFGFLIVAVVVVGGAVAYGVVQGQRENRRGLEQPTPQQTTEAPFESNQETARGQPAKEAFAHTCGTCHTLRRAGVRGIIGPDLDKAVLTEREVREMIRTGSLDSTMPKNLLVGEEADRVARYVARQSLASRRARAEGRG
jgi:mono/diheme cytochrome c family protein